MTLALATLSTVLFLIDVAQVPGEALFAVVVAVAAMRRVLRRVDMSLTAPVLTVPHARHVQPRR